MKKQEVNVPLKQEPVAWILQYCSPNGQQSKPIHISKHDGWSVIVVMTEEKNDK